MLHLAPRLVIIRKIMTNVFVARSVVFARQMENESICLGANSSVLWEDVVRAKCLDTVHGADFWSCLRGDLAAPEMQRAERFQLKPKPFFFFSHEAFVAELELSSLQNKQTNKHSY